MNSILVKLVEEDFGVHHDSTRWARAEEHNSLIIDKEKDRFHWNSKVDDNGDVLHGDAYIYLTQVRNLSSKEARDILKQFTNYVGTFIHEVSGSDEQIIYPGLVDSFHENIWQDSREYFHKRTITDETIRKWRLGKWSDLYTIPVYYDGVLKNIQLRKDFPKTIRFYYPGKPVIFNEDILKYSNVIFVVEGVTSCIVLNQNNIPAVSPSHGANTFKEEFMVRFMNKKIIILFDNDEAGNTGSIKVAKILGQLNCKIYNFWDFKPHYDANDWFIGGGTREELLTLIKEKAKYSFQIHP